MTEQSLQGLLLDCGFQNLLWTPLRGQKWAVVGELDGGIEITVACTAGPVLHVPSETARDLLSDMLAQNGTEAQILVDKSQLFRETSPWVTLAIGAGAVAFFSWVVSTLR